METHGTQLMKDDGRRIVYILTGKENTAEAKARRGMNIVGGLWLDRTLSTDEYWTAMRRIEEDFASRFYENQEAQR